MKTHLEIEAKYDLADGQPLPDLCGVGGVAVTVAQAELVLTATYFDTADHSLVAAGATLRSRTGGADDGWHLKLPLADGERLEVHRALGRGQSPPAELTALVRALVRSNPLERVATLVNRRRVHQLLDRDGRVLAELADDSVTGERHDVVADALAWRELEIELVDGDRAVLADLDAAVRAAGVVPATGASKVGRVLGVPPRVPHRAKSRPSTPVGEVLETALRQAVLDLRAADPLVRLDRPAAPTRMRAAVQRLRAGLAVQQQVIPDEVTTSIRSELAWLDLVVAGVEELDTTRARIRDALAVEAKERVVGPVGLRVDRQLAAGRRMSLALVREALDSPRYLDLLERLVQLPTRTPPAAAAAGRAGDVLPGLADGTLRRAQRRLAQLGRVGSDDESRRRLRGAQRAVERARYAELLGSGRTGPTQGRLESSLDEVAAILAGLAVSTRTQEVLRDLAAQADLVGESGFTLGRLHALEQARALSLVGDTKRLRRELRRLRRL